MSAAVEVAGAETLIRSAPATRPVWYLVGVSRKKVRTILVAMLELGDPGEFLVRDASEKPGPGEIAKYKMSVKESKQTVLTYLIIKTAVGAWPAPDAGDDGAVIQAYTAGSGPSAPPTGPAYGVYGTSEIFASLEQLVEFYTETHQDSLSIQLQPPRFKEYAAAALQMPDIEPARAPPKPVPAPEPEPAPAPAPPVKTGLDDLTKKMTMGGYGTASYNFTAPHVAEVPLAAVEEVVDDQAVYDIAAMGDSEYTESGPTPAADGANELATAPESVAVQAAVTENLAPVDYELASDANVEYLECVDTIDPAASVVEPAPAAEPVALQQAAMRTTTDPAPDEEAPDSDDGLDGPAAPVFQSNDFVLDKNHQSVRLKSVARGNPLFQEEDGDAGLLNDRSATGVTIAISETIAEDQPEGPGDPGSAMYHDDNAALPATMYRRPQPNITYSSMSDEGTYGNRPKSEALYAIAGLGLGDATTDTMKRGDESNYGLSGQEAEDCDAIYGLADAKSRPGSQIYGAPLGDAERGDDDNYSNRAAPDPSVYGLNGAYQLGNDMKFRLGQMQLSGNNDIDVVDPNDDDDDLDIYPMAEAGDVIPSMKRPQGRKKGGRPKSEGPYMLAVFPDRNSVTSAGRSSTYGTQGGEGVYGLSGKAAAVSDAVYGMAGQGDADPTYGRGSLIIDRAATDWGDSDSEALYGRGSLRPAKKNKARPVSALYGLGSDFNDILSHDTEVDGSPPDSPVMTRRGQSSIRRITPRSTGMNKALAFLGISEEEAKGTSPTPSPKRSPTPGKKKKYFRGLSAKK